MATEVERAAMESLRATIPAADIIEDLIIGAECERACGPVSSTARCSAGLCAGEMVSVVCADPLAGRAEVARGSKLTRSTVVGADSAEAPAEGHLADGWVFVGNGLAKWGRKQQALQTQNSSRSTL